MTEEEVECFGGRRCVFVRCGSEVFLVIYLGRG